MKSGAVWYAVRSVPDYIRAIRCSWQRAGGVVISALHDPPLQSLIVLLCARPPG